MSHDRKAFSAEPQTAAALYGKRWEDLIDAAASATEEDSRDLTPVSATQATLSSQHIDSLGASISKPFATYERSILTSSIRGATFPVLCSLTIAQGTNAPSARANRTSTVSLSRIFNRVRSLRCQFSYPVSRAL
jgi:hypothetical protein